MSVSPISYLPLDTAVGLSGNATSKVTGQDFAAWLNQQLQNVNQQILDSDTQVRELALGDAASLHQVMMSLDKAKMSFDLALQVRNKVLDAYQQIMKMQI